MTDFFHGQLKQALRKKLEDFLDKADEGKATEKDLDTAKGFLDAYCHL
jgi:hypothetical protein